MTKKLLNPKNDYVFKRIFGHIGNEHITKDFLDSILLDEKITNVKLDNSPILEKDLLDDKIGIIDINAQINNEISCDIELQIVDKKNIEKRALYYWSKLFTKNIKEGDDYSKLKKAVVILILDYNLSSIVDIPKYITKWNFREEDFPKKILTPVAEIYIIELDKFKKYQQNSKYKALNSWIKFIESPGDIDMNTEKNVAIKEAKKELEKISSDEHEEYLAHLRQKYIMDSKAIEDAGYDKGFKQGTEQGFNQGKINEKLKIAKNLKSQNLDINLIAEATGLTKEEIEKL